MGKKAAANRGYMIKPVTQWMTGVSSYGATKGAEVFRPPTLKSLVKSCSQCHM